MTQLELFAPSMTDRITAILLAIFSRQVYVGATYSCGPYTPAVARADDPPWAVVNRRGGTLVLAHDPFEAARWCALFESGAMDEPEEPIRLWSDAEARELHRNDVEMDLRAMRLI